MATSYWNPFGVALNVTATGGTVTRTSATTFTVKINAAWEVYYSGNKTNYGMTASAGGGSVNLNTVGNKVASGSGSFTGTFSISGYGAQTKSITVTFRNYNDLGDSANGWVAFNVSVPAWTSYTVAYNANGGSGAPGNQTKYKDVTLTLSSTKPTRTGYTFNGWNTNSGGTGTAYASGANYSTNAAVTLYAQWTANTYTIKYDANGGSGAPSNQTKTYGTDLTLSSTKPTRVNYNFLGWSTNSSASTAQYAAGGKYTTDAATTLYAVWELAYRKPTIEKLSASRCTSNGTADDFNTYAKVTFDFELCQLTGTNNPKTVKIEYKLQTETSYGTPVTVPSTSYSLVETTSDSKKKYTCSYVIGGSLDSEKTYDIRVTVTDDKGGTDSLPTTVGSSAFPIDILNEGKGVAFGKAATTANVVDSAWRYQNTVNGITSSFGAKNSSWCHYETTAPSHWFNKPVAVQGDVFGGVNYNRQLAYVDSTPQLRDKTAISSSANLNNLRTPGTYACNDATAASLTNSPTTHGFSMDVSYSYGDANFISQRIFVPYDEVEYARRYNVSAGTWSAWKSDFAEDTGWVTLNSVIKYRRVGKTVFIWGESSGVTSLASGSYTSVGTLPAGFRPSMSIPFTWNALGGDVWTQTSYVTSGGSIEMYHKEGVAESYWRFSVAFPVDTSV